MGYSEKIFSVFLFLNHLFTTAQSQQSTEQYHLCSTEQGNFTANSNYQKNLDLLFSNPAKSLNGYGFYNLTEGQEPDQVYGIALCRGDIDRYACLGCITFSATNLRRNCSNQKEAIIWDDVCVLRYSNRFIFGFNESSPVLYMWNMKNVTNVGAFNNALGTLLHNLSNKAALGDSLLKFATGTAPVPPTDTIYALVQCTPDLSQLQCNSCLSDAIKQIPECCNGKQGGRVIMPSCNIRFEIYLFYGKATGEPPPPEQPSSPPPPLPEQPPSPPPPLTEMPSAPLPSPGSKPKWIPIVASLSAVLGLTLVGSFSFIIWRRINSREDKENSQEVQLLDLRGGNFGNEYSNEDFQGDRVGGSQEFPSIHLDIINAATKHFCDENKLGEGGFGPVYKGTLADGKEIAVKRLSRTSGQGLLEFKNEVMLIARLQHRNLVRLLGCCLEDNETLLVYEYMPNRSLDVFLFDSSMSVKLDWQKRYSIIKGIARGIMYLHEDSRLRIIHRDLKASNILLDGDMNPKISDFGMARIFGGNQSEANTNRVVGTYGYMAPEYAMEGLFSVKSDVFSFGVLLLEIISGKKNKGFHLSEYGESLLTFAWKLWSKGQGMEMIEPLLLQSCVASEVLKCIHIGLLCVQEDPADRPTMSSVIVMLVGETMTLPKPAEPAFSVGRVVAKPVLPSLDIVNSVNEAISPLLEDILLRDGKDP
ncbi:hypothetical protein SLE2022_392540 [Rubroshorea leprosula]